MVKTGARYQRQGWTHKGHGVHVQGHGQVQVLTDFQSESTIIGEIMYGLI